MKKIDRKLGFKKKGKIRAIVDGFIGMCIDDDAMYRALLFSFGIFFFVALLFPVTFYEQVAVFSLSMLFLFAETVNTAIEYTVDRVGPEFHPLSMRAKDSAAAASFIVWFLLVIVVVCLCYNSMAK